MKYRRKAPIVWDSYSLCCLALWNCGRQIAAPRYSDAAQLANEYICGNVVAGESLADCLRKVCEKNLGVGVKFKCDLLQMMAKYEVMSMVE